MKRVNVPGALRQDGKLVWCTQQRPTVRNDVIAFLDRLSEAPHASPRIVVIDNAAIHKGEAMDSKRQQWAAMGSSRAVPVLPSAIQPGTQQDRDSLEAGQILLAKILQFKRRRTSQ